jgi:cell division protein FtsW
MRIRPPRVFNNKSGPIDYWLLAIVVVLVAFGAVMVYSASFATAYARYGNGAYWVLRQLQWVVVGSALMFIGSRIDYRVWRKLALPAMVIVLVMLIVVVTVHSISPLIDGARRWIIIGPIPSIQPSELAKLVLIFYVADWLEQKRDRLGKFSYGLIPFGLMLGTIIGLVMLEPDLGTSVVVAGIGISMFFVAGGALIQLFGVFAMGGAAFIALVMSASYRMNRITIFLDPWKDPQNLGYHPIQALLALGSGGLLGVGLGASRQKFSWLPAAHTDAIFAVIGEELGFIGATFVILLFLSFAVRGYIIAMRAKDPFGMLVATGITTWVVLQATLNIGVATTTIPFTGIPLPFISYGGSSLAFTMLGVGVLMSISREAGRGRDAAQKAGSSVSARPGRRAAG